MAYTVKKLARLSGVSIRTLHFYDEIGLLKPAYQGSNGYRYYEEPQLLALQQILFFRELGFELKQIKKVLNKGDFDKVAALHSHRQVLEKNVERTQQLLETIDKTIAHLKGVKKMKDTDMYGGFITKEKQAEYKQYLLNCLGDEVKDSLELCEKKMKEWTQAEWDRFSQEWNAICQDLAQLKKRDLSPDASEVQKVIRRHYHWLPWVASGCSRDAYIGLGQGYTGFEWGKAFKPHDPHHPQLAQFLAEGMRIFAMRELS
ncbi:MAG TPA: MerR family transcriptional regulator [Rhabdochlamydiaceae bacterium]|jgi:DNA-binding transcriptional MerR regulator